MVALPDFGPAWEVPAYVSGPETRLEGAHLECTWRGLYFGVVQNASEALNNGISAGDRKWQVDKDVCTGRTSKPR